MNGDQTEENTLRGFYAYKNTFDREVIWLDTPKDGMSCHFNSSCHPLMKL
jgi:hypothetical protein